jgi:hypothetical protein
MDSPDYDYMRLGVTSKLITINSVGCDLPTMALVVAGIEPAHSSVLSAVLRTRHGSRTHLEDAKVLQVSCSQVCESSSIVRAHNLRLFLFNSGSQ